MIRPRLKVSQEAWDFFLTQIPQFEQMVEKLSEYKSLGNVDDLALPYTLHEFLPSLTLLFAAAFNPEVFEPLFTQGQKDVLKFIKLVKDKQFAEDSLKWAECDKEAVPSLYPHVDNSNAAKDILRWIGSKDASIINHELDNSVFFIKSVFTFRCLCAWLDSCHIPYITDTNKNIENRKLKTLWYDYMIKIN